MRATIYAGMLAVVSVPRLQYFPTAFMMSCGRAPSVSLFDFLTFSSGTKHIVRGGLRSDVRNVKHCVGHSVAFVVDVEPFESSAYL